MEGFDSFLQILEERRRCASICRGVYDYVNHRLSQTNLAIEPLEPDSYCFRISFPQNNLPFTHLSVSVPPDANQNDEYQIIESLFFNNDEPVYQDTHPELYDDVWRCETQGEMVDEILRIYRVFCSNDVPQPICQVQPEQPGLPDLPDLPELPEGMSE